MGVHEATTDQRRICRLERNQQEVLVLFRNLAKRVQYVESQIGTEESKRTLEWRDQIKEKLSRLLVDQDWEGLESEEYKRRRYAEMDYELVLQLAYMLPLEEALDLWRQYAPSKEPKTIEPAPRPHEGMSDKKLLKAMKVT